MATSNTTERGERIEAAKQALRGAGSVVSPSTLAKELNVGEATVQRWLGELGEEGRKGVRNRMDVDSRKASILQAALDEASAAGVDKMTRKAIAERAGVTVSLVNKYLGTMIQLRRTVMRQAVKHSVLPIIAQGLASRNAYALKASPELKAAALASLSGE